MHLDAKRAFFVAPTIYREDGRPRIQRVLIANRGEIACRIIDACKNLGVTPIAVYADADEHALHTKKASEAHYIGPADGQPYLDAQLLIDVAKRCDADAIHPGYGYLSENAEFAKAVEDTGIIFIGPSPDSIAALGDKREAKELLRERCTVPLVPGYSGLEQTPDMLEERADEMGYPVMIKASAGGGGRGMRIVHEKAKFRGALMSCSSEAKRSFGSGHCILEKYIQAGKHVEIQIFGDGETFISLLDRECSVQRRHQKVIEESPCAWLSAELRERMSDAALQISRLLHYRSAGTVEFIVDIEKEKFYFLEVNTRIQVEHPVTEEVTGIDIVALQFYVSAGGKLSDLANLKDIRQQGHAIEVRLCAEDPFSNFVPCSGVIEMFRPCSDVLGSVIPRVRYDSGVEDGSVISVHFDSLISKIIVWSPDRHSAIQKMIQALKHTVCLGITTNQMFLQTVLSHFAFQRHDYTTALIDTHRDELLRPLDPGPFLSTSVIVASLFHDTIKKHLLLGSGSAFRTIPKNFRNQHKDETKTQVKHMSCDFKMLGHAETLDILLADDADGCYRVWSMPDEAPPTEKQRAVYLNKLGGALARRYYNSLKAKDAQVVNGVKAVDSSLHGKNGVISGTIRVSIGGKVLKHWVAKGLSDEMQAKIYVQCPADGIFGSFAVSSKLAWAGRLAERANGSSETDPTKQHTSTLTGKVLRILAQDGDSVKKGDSIVVLESMKMEVQVVAATSGKLLVLVKEGQFVQDGTLLYEIRDKGNEKS